MIFPNPSTDRFKTTVKHGNAIVPYTTVEQEQFNTEFAAKLFGWLTCAAADRYHYWVAEKLNPAT